MARKQPDASATEAGIEPEGGSVSTPQCPTLDNAIRCVISDHERRTGTTVISYVANLPSAIPPFINVSLCLFVQEGLNNAWRHAAGKGQSVAVWADDVSVSAEVADEGPGIMLRLASEVPSSLGLAGLSNGIESLGGTMQIQSVRGEGTRITATIPIIASERRRVI